MMMPAWASLQRASKPRARRRLKKPRKIVSRFIGVVIVYVVS